MSWTTPLGLKIIQPYKDERASQVKHCPTTSDCQTMNICMYIFVYVCLHICMFLMVNSFAAQDHLAIV
jgi:hypothetical protein